MLGSPLKVGLAWEGSGGTNSEGLTGDCRAFWGRGVEGRGKGRMKFVMEEPRVAMVSWLRDS